MLGAHKSRRWGAARISPSQDQAPRAQVHLLCSHAQGRHGQGECRPVSPTGPWGERCSWSLLLLHREQGQEPASDPHACPPGDTMRGKLFIAAGLSPRPLSSLAGASPGHTAPGQPQGRLPALTDTLVCTQFPLEEPRRRLSARHVERVLQELLTTGHPTLGPDAELRLCRVKIHLPHPIIAHPWERNRRAAMGASALRSDSPWLWGAGPRIAQVRGLALHEGACDHGEGSGSESGAGRGPRVWGARAWPLSEAVLEEAP